MNRRCLLFCVCVTIPLMAAAADWATFRGPDGNGISQAKRLPTEWSDTKNVTWRTEVPGLGWSSPVIASGKIYLTAAVLKNSANADSSMKDYSLELICLDARSGNAEWNVTVFEQLGANAPKIHAKNSHASPTAIVDGNRVYVHFGHMGTACVGTDGKVIWRNESLKYSPVHGNGGTPVLVDGRLFFSCDGAKNPFFVALDAMSGEVVWKVERKTDAAKTFSFSTPTLITVAGQKQLISPGSNVACAFDPADGREIWRVRYDGFSVIPKPVYASGLVFVCTGYGTPSLLAISPDGKGDVTDSHVSWTTKRSVPHSASLLAVGSELYMVADAGVATCLDAATGKVHWQERVAGNYSASPIFAAGKVYFQSEQGDTTVVEASTKFRVISKSTLNQRTLASYAISGETLFLRSESHLYRID